MIGGHCRDQRAPSLIVTLGLVTGRFMLGIELAMSVSVKLEVSMIL